MNVDEIDKLCGKARLMLDQVRAYITEIDVMLEEIEQLCAPPPDLDNAVREGEEDVA